MSETKEEGPDTAPGLQWTPAIDRMLANWCDQAKSFNWMHTHSYSRYSRGSTAMNIGTNIAISLVGVVNLALASSQIEAMTTAMVTGSVSVAIGIIKMIQEQFNWASLASDYKHSATKWDHISRKIQEQVVLPYTGRKDCGTFLKYIKQDINEASDTNTIIPKDIRNKCMEKFGKIPDFDIPDICGQVEHTTVYVEQPTSTLQVPLLTSNTISAKHADPVPDPPPGVVHSSESA
jgi:hypothetical protein